MWQQVDRCITSPTTGLGLQGYQTEAEIGSLCLERSEVKSVSAFTSTEADIERTEKFTENEKNFLNSEHQKKKQFNFEQSCNQLNWDYQPSSNLECLEVPTYYNNHQGNSKLVEIGKHLSSSTSHLSNQLKKPETSQIFHSIAHDFDDYHGNNSTNMACNENASWYGDDSLSYQPAAVAGFSEHFVASAGQEAHIPGEMQLGSFQKIAEGNENHPSVILHVQTFTDCKVELPQRNGTSSSSYLPLTTAFGANSIQSSPPLKFETNTTAAAESNIVDSNSWKGIREAGPSYYNDVSSDKGRIFEVPQKIHSDSKFLPHDKNFSSTTATQRDGQRLVVREQRRTSIFIDYPANEGFQQVPPPLPACHWSGCPEMTNNPPLYQPGFQSRPCDYQSIPHKAGHVEAIGSEHTLWSTQSMDKTNLNPNVEASRIQSDAKGEYSMKFPIYHHHQEHQHFSDNHQNWNPNLPNPDMRDCYSKECVAMNGAPENVFASPRTISWIPNESYLNSNNPCIIPSPSSMHFHSLAPMISRTGYASGEMNKRGKTLGKSSDSKKIACGEPNCTKRFSRQQDLQVHINKHHLEMLKPYVCNHCEKNFKRPDQLKRHEKIHTGEKPHICRVCGRGFARTDHRNMHENKHSDDEKVALNKSSCNVPLSNRHNGRNSRKKLKDKSVTMSRLTNPHLVDLERSMNKQHLTANIQSIDQSYMNGFTSNHLPASTSEVPHFSSS